MKNKTLTRVVLIVLAAVLIIAPFTYLIPAIMASAATPVQISVDTVAQAPGELITIKVSATEDANVISGSFNLVYDSTKLEYVSVKAGSALSGAIVVANPQTSKLCISYASNTASTLAGSLVELVFKTSASTPTQTIPLTYQNIYLENATGAPIYHTIKQGSVVLEKYLLGDTNNDGKISIVDAELILNYLSGRTTFTSFQENAADVDKDSSVTSSDARLILQYTKRFFTNFDDLPVYVDSISLNATKKSIETDSSTELTATLTPSYATKNTVTWSTLNPKIATVSDKGIVTGVSVGTTTITASANNGSAVATCTITVTQNATPEKPSEGEGTEEENPVDPTILQDGYYLLKFKDSSIYATMSAIDTSPILSLSNKKDGLLPKFYLKANGEAGMTINPLATPTAFLSTSTTNGILCDSNKQSWTITKNNDNTYHIADAQKMALTASSKTSSATLSTKPLNASDALQKWELIPVTPTKRTGTIVNTEGEGLSVRATPASAGTKLGVFAEGSAITILDDIQNGWYRVSGINRNTGAIIEGYSHSDFIEITQ